MPIAEHGRLPGSRATAPRMQPRGDNDTAPSPAMTASSRWKAHRIQRHFGENGEKPQKHFMKDQRMRGEHGLCLTGRVLPVVQHTPGCRASAKLWLPSPAVHADHVRMACDLVKPNRPAVRACGELQAVGGHFKQLARGETSMQKCTVKAGLAQGKWGDRDVNYAAMFPGRCGLQKATGSVFTF